MQYNIYIKTGQRHDIQTTDGGVLDRLQHDIIQMPDYCIKPCAMSTVRNIFKQVCVKCKLLFDNNVGTGVHTVCRCFDSSVSVKIDTHQPRRKATGGKTNISNIVKNNKNKAYCVTLEYKISTSTVECIQLRGFDVYEFLNAIHVTIYKHLNIHVTTGVDIADAYMTNKLYIMPEVYTGAVNPIEKTSGEDISPVCGPATAQKQLKNYVEKTRKHGKNNELDYTKFNIHRHRLIQSHGTGKHSPFHDICDIVMHNTGRAMITAIHEMHVNMGPDMAKDASIITSRHEITDDTLYTLFIQQKIKKVWIDSKSKYERIIKCSPVCGDIFVICDSRNTCTTVTDHNIDSINDIIYNIKCMWYLIRNGDKLSPKSTVDNYINANIVYIERDIIDGDIILVFRHPMLSVGFLPIKVYVKKHLNKCIEISNADVKYNWDFDGDILNIRIIPTYIAKLLYDDYAERQRLLSGGVSFRFNGYVSISLNIMSAHMSPIVPHHVVIYILENIYVFTGLEKRVVIDANKQYTGVELISICMPCVDIISPNNDFAIAGGEVKLPITESNIHVLYEYLHNASTPLDARNAIIGNIYFIAGIWATYNDACMPVDDRINNVREDVIQYAHRCKEELHMLYMTEYKSKMSSHTVMSQFVTKCIMVQREIKKFAHSLKNRISDYIPDYDRNMSVVYEQDAVDMYIYNEQPLSQDFIEECISRSILNPIMVIAMACSTGCIKSGVSKTDATRYAKMAKQQTMKSEEIRRPGYHMRKLLYCMVIRYDNAYNIYASESKKTFTSTVANVDPQLTIQEAVPLYADISGLSKYNNSKEFIDIHTAIQTYMLNNIIRPTSAYAPFRIIDQIAYYMAESVRLDTASDTNENYYYNEIYLPFITTWYGKLNDPSHNSNIPFSCNLYIYCVYWLHPHTINNRVCIGYQYTAAMNVVEDLSYVFNITDNYTFAHTRMCNKNHETLLKKRILFEPNHNITETIPGRVMGSTSQSFLDGIKTDKVNASPLSMAIDRNLSDMFILFFSKGMNLTDINGFVMHYLGNVDILLSSVCSMSNITSDTIDSDGFCITVTVDIDLNYGISVIEKLCSIVTLLMRNLGYNNIPDMYTYDHIKTVLLECKYYKNQYIKTHMCDGSNRIKVDKLTDYMYTVYIPYSLIKLSHPDNYSEDEEALKHMLLKGFNRHYIRRKVLDHIPRIQDVDKKYTTLNCHYYKRFSDHYIVVEAKPHIVSGLPPDLIRHDMTISTNMEYMSVYSLRTIRQNISILAAMSDTTPEIAISMILILTVTGSYKSLCAVNIIQNPYSDARNLLPFERTKNVLSRLYVTDPSGIDIISECMLSNAQTQDTDQSNCNADIRLNIHRTEKKYEYTVEYKNEMYRTNVAMYTKFLSCCNVHI